MSGLFPLILYFVYLLLLLANDVELNPGPPKRNTRQARLTSPGQLQTKRRSTDTVQPEAVPTTQVSSKGPTLQDIRTLIHYMTDSMDQTCRSISDTHFISKAQSTPEVTTEDIPMAEPTVKDLMFFMHSKFNEVKTNLLELTNVCTGTQEEILNLKQQMVELKEENEAIKSANSLLSDRVEVLERKTDKLESLYKRNNIIFHGIPQKKKETNGESEKTIHKLLTNNLQLSEDIKSEKVHPISNKPDSPILVRSSCHKQKEVVFKNHYKLQGTRIFIGEDLPVRIREIRKKLVPFLKDATKSGKKATIIYDYLVIDGQKFDLGDDGLELSNS